MNVICLLGRLTADPELRHTANQVSVTSFTVAVDRRFVAQGQERQADFINIVAWRQTAEFITKYFRKGQRIAINGSLQSRSYTDKDGNKRTAYEVVADNAYFCESKSSGSSMPQGDYFPLIFATLLYSVFLNYYISNVFFKKNLLPSLNLMLIGYPTYSAANVIPALMCILPCVALF